MKFEFYGIVSPTVHYFKFQVLQMITLFTVLENVNKLET